MKFIRLRIANYRGISSAEVNFSPAGITLIQGPNEAGKTSLGEAIGFLFDCPDSSKMQCIKDIKPVHKDEGPEIELQAESGPYVFVYSKRFLKKPETKLSISKPKPENFTGREAHERADAILHETIDYDLWRALIIQQGNAIEQPDLTKQSSLSAALDSAAGGRPADPRQENLFDKTKMEFLLYYTSERGAERKELTEARKSQSEIEEQVKQIEQAIRDLDHDIDRAAMLQRELGQLKKREQDLQTQISGYDASLEEIGVLENALNSARLKLEVARKSEQFASRDKETRQGLIEAFENANNALAGVKESSEMSLPALNQADAAFGQAQKDFGEIEQKKKAIDALVTLRRADFDYYNNKLFLDQLQERKDRIDQVRKNAENAEMALANNKVDSRVLKLIQGAERELLSANAQLSIGAPSMSLRGLSDVKFLIDDAEVNLNKGTIRTIPVADKLRLTVPDELEIEITAGASAEGLARKVDEARRNLENACIKAAVASPDDARNAFEERRVATQFLESKTQVEKDNLRDLTYDDLTRRICSLEQMVSNYLTTRPVAPSICSDLDSAKKERVNAETLQKELVGRHESVRDSLESARSLRDGLYSKHQEAFIQLEMLTKDLDQARENLNKAQKSVPDEALDEALATTIQKTTNEYNHVVETEASLKAMNPGRVKTLAETARGSLRTAQKSYSTAQTELTEVQTRLKIHGEEGLYEKLHDAQTNLERLKAKNSSLFRCAAAAKLLFETMREERDNARREYVAPLKEKIEQLGLLVFDDSFEVDINDDLQIASRTLRGVTVPFDSLSGGTKEQLSLIFRSACSIIVSKDGGAPLILDDALGYTDPDRLHLMGAVLAKAAKDCQIIILTCLPARYGNIGEASVVNMNSCVEKEKMKFGSTGA
jgi:DNA repair exonuclease SbcCD ATPase subunit